MLQKGGNKDKFSRNNKDIVQWKATTNVHVMFRKTQFLRSSEHESMVKFRIIWKPHSSAYYHDIFIFALFSSEKFRSRQILVYNIYSCDARHVGQNFHHKLLKEFPQQRDIFVCLRALLVMWSTCFRIPEGNDQQGRVVQSWVR